MFEKIATAASNSDDAIFHLVGGGVNLQDCGCSFETGNSGGSGGDTGGQ